MAWTNLTPAFIFFLFPYLPLLASLVILVLFVYFTPLDAKYSKNKVIGTPGAGVRGRSPDPSPAFPELHTHPSLKELATTGSLTPSPGDPSRWSHQAPCIFPKLWKFLQRPD